MGDSPRPDPDVLDRRALLATQDRRALAAAFACEYLPLPPPPSREELEAAASMLLGFGGLA